MTFKKIVIAILLGQVCIQAIAGGAAQAHLPPVAKRPYGQNYKDAALIYCMTAAFPNTPALNNDASYTMSGINEWTSANMDGNDALAALAKKYLAREYHSVHGPQVKLQMLKCLDFYHSKELDALTKKYVPHPKRSFAQDK